MKEIPDNIKADLKIHPVKWVDEVLEIALQTIPNPLSNEDYFKSSGENLDDKDDGDASSRVSTH